MYTIVAAVIGFFAVVLGLIIVVFADDIKHWIRRQGPIPNESAVIIPIETYDTRNSSDEAMITDIARLKSAVFFGVSHPNLATYLRSALQRLGAKEAIDHIEIYYASDEDGRLWEHEAYRGNVMRTRQDIAELLTSPQWLPPRVNSVKFLQSQHHATNGGCLVGKPGEDHVVYVVNYLPTPNPDAKESLTFRLAVQQGREDSVSQLATLYATGYQHIRNKAFSLGDFSPSLWDLSAVEWARFASTCNAHMASMRFLCEFGDFSGVENVIDVACGDGATSEILSKCIGNGRLTVLDASPQMVARAKTVLPNTVRFSLQVVPPRNNARMIDLVPPYDVVVVHLSLPSIANSLASLSEFARWSRIILADTGHLLIAAHNTAVHLEQSTFDIKNDPLREAIREFTDKKLWRNPRNGPVFTVQDIEGAIAEAGYSLQQSRVQSFPLTMRDRVAMWSTPAVLDDMIDVHRTSAEQRKELMSKVWTRVAGKATPDMTVKYWKWSLN